MGTTHNKKYLIYQPEIIQQQSNKSVLKTMRRIIYEKIKNAKTINNKEEIRKNRKNTLFSQSKVI